MKLRLKTWTTRRYVIVYHWPLLRFGREKLRPGGIYAWHLSIGPFTWWRRR